MFLCVPASACMSPAMYGEASDSKAETVMTLKKSKNAFRGAL